MGLHLDCVARGLEPDLGWVEEEQALVPAVVVLAVGLEGIRGDDDGDAVVAADGVDGDGVGEGAGLVVRVGVEFEDNDFVLGSVGEFVDGIDIARKRLQVGGRVEVFGPDVDVEPDFAIVLAKD